MHHPTDRLTHTTAFVTPVVEHWLERQFYKESSNYLSVMADSVSVGGPRSVLEVFHFAVPAGDGGVEVGVAVRHVLSDTHPGIG